MCFILVSSGVFAYSLALWIKGINNSAWPLSTNIIYLHSPIKLCGVLESLCYVWHSHICWWMTKYYMLYINLYFIILFTCALHFKIIYFKVLIYEVQSNQLIKKMILKKTDYLNLDYLCFNINFLVMSKRLLAIAVFLDSTPVLLYWCFCDAH